MCRDVTHTDWLLIGSNDQAVFLCQAEWNLRFLSLGKTTVPLEIVKEEINTLGLDSGVRFIRWPHLS